MSNSISGDLTGEIRLLLESARRAAEGALFPGQRLSARVIEMLVTGDVLLELGKSRLTVSTSTPLQLQSGDRVRVEVVTAGPTPELRIVTDKTAVAPQAGTVQSTGAPVAPAVPGAPAAPAAPGAPAATAVADQPATLSPRDLPVIMRALAEMMPAGIPIIPIAKAGQTFLQAAAAADLQPAVVEQIQRLLAPLHASLPPAELAPMMRDFLAQSGLFTENHLGAALQKHPGSLSLTADQRSPLTPDQRQAIADVRLLLGELTPAGTPMPDPVRVFAEAVLREQLVVAEQLAATNSGQVAIPFMFGEECVDVRFTWDRQARQETAERPSPDDDQTISLGVFVNLSIFGGIEARLVWKPESFAVTFYVEREDTRAIVEAGLSELSKELAASGFPAVTTNVWFNPDRVSAGVTPAKPAIPAGTILDVMA
jgi:hypothetical protein